MDRTRAATGSGRPLQRSAALYQRLAASAFGRWLCRYRRFLPVASFAAGAASFFLVERQVALAQWLAVLLLLGWVWLLAERLIGRWLSRWIDVRLSEGAARFGAQALHQEALFFVLPFFLATTSWNSGQAAYTGSVILAALASTVDPIYFDRIAARRWLFLGFHAFTMFAALLVALPVLMHLTTGQSLGLAAAAMAVFALPSLGDAIQVRRWWRWFLLTGLAIALASVAWITRGWIPPATLRMTEGAITQRVDTARREPASELSSVSPGDLANGLYAFTAIKAPRGLNQPILHVWSHEGEVVDRIPLEIVGGREQGYRAWSHKNHFPDDPTGRWRVSVATQDGQLLGVVRFKVQAGGD